MKRRDEPGFKPKGPSKHFFSIDNSAFEAMLYRYRVPSIDRRVWGWLVRFTWGIRAGDRYQVDRKKAAIALGVHVKSIDTALQSLLKHGAIIRYEEARKGKPAVYGPNKFAESWTYPLEEGVQRPVRPSKKPPQKAQIGESKQLTHSEEKVSQTDSPISEIGESNRLTYQAENDSPISEASPCHVWAGSHPKTQILNTDLKYMENGCVYGGPENDVITTAQEALKRQDVPHSLALVSAEKSYLKRFGRSLTIQERADLSDFLSLSPYRGSLLAFWLKAVEVAYSDRLERKRQPEKAKWVSRYPYKDVRHFAAEEYEATKAAQEARTGQQGGRLTG